MKKPTRKKPSPKVKSMTLSRLYNTGNYTNVSYSITVDVPKGASAKGTLFELVHILTMLKPFGRPACMEQLDEARKLPETEQSTFQKENLEAWSEKVQQYHQRCADRQAALESLDDLGGTIEKRDAKRNWQDYDEDVPW